MFQPYSNENMIQIWSLGNLSKFFFFFFSKNDFWFTVIKIKKDHIGRLGLLGVVFGNGSLGVFSIPDPTELKEKHRNEKPLCKDTIFFFPQKIY